MEEVVYDRIIRELAYRYGIYGMIWRYAGASRMVRSRYMGWIQVWYN